jgi:hypothetical protein
MPASRIAKAVRLFALLAGAAVLALAVHAAPAAAAKPCWKKVVEDWFDNEKIDRRYPISCYRTALKNLPEDVKDYTSIGDDINAAMLAAQRSRPSRTLQVAGGNGGDSSGDTRMGPSDPKTSDPTVGPNRSFYKKAIDSIGPSKADSVPIPLIILAALGGTLLAAAAAMLAVKKLRGRGLFPFR